MEDGIQVASDCVLESRVENKCGVSLGAVHVSSHLGVLSSYIGHGFLLEGRRNPAGWLWSPQSGGLAFQDSRDGIQKTQIQCMVRVYCTDPRSADAEMSSPESEDRAIVRHAL